MNFGVFIGRIVGGFCGLCLGVTLGLWAGGSLAPVIGSIIGLFAGVLFSGFVFKMFPRLAPAQTMSAVAASCGMSGLIGGLFIGDAIGTFGNFDRSYSALIGASLGLYLGVLIGNARR
jgi:uncharacterized membrane protein